MIYGILYIKYITCEFTNIISCIYVYGKGTALNLAPYLSNTSPKMHTKDTDSLFEKSFAKYPFNSEKNFDVR